MSVFAAEIAGQHANHQRHQRANAGSQETHDHRQLGANQNPRQHIPPKVIRAERKIERRRLQPMLEIRLVHAIGREKVRKDAAEQEHEENRAASGPKRLLPHQPLEERKQPAHDPGRRQRRRQRTQHRLRHWCRTLGSSQP